MPLPPDLAALDLDYDVVVIYQDEIPIIHETHFNDTLTPYAAGGSGNTKFANYVAPNGNAWSTAIEWREDDNHYYFYIQGQEKFAFPEWYTESNVFDLGEAEPNEYSGTIDGWNAANGWEFISGSGGFTIHFAHDCECILNTLHCAGLTLAGFCGTDKHTAAVILGTAGGIVRGGIKADAAKINGALGGWYSWH